MTFAEAKLVLGQARKTEAVYKQQEDFDAPDLQQEIMQIVKDERDKQSKSVSELSKTKRLKGIRDNRQAERDYERQKDRNKLADQSKNEEPAKIIPIRSSDDVEHNSFDYPDLDVFLEDDDD